MSKHPVLNAIAAFLYIALIATFFYLANTYLAHKPDNNFLAPIAFISLFTLSAAVMGYIFLSQPAQLYFDGKKREAINLFLKTVASFGVITFIALGLLFTGVFG